jgi:hypothetical protein
MLGHQIVPHCKTNKYWKCFDTKVIPPLINTSEKREEKERKKRGGVEHPSQSYLLPLFVKYSDARAKFFPTF